MITKKQSVIFSVFMKNAFKEYTFNEIKKLSKEKSNSLLQNAIKVFIKEDILKERKINNSKLYSINHDNKLVYYYFNLITQKILLSQVKKAISILENELNKHTLFYSTAIFGSYASNEQKKNSDLDLAIFIDDENKRKIVEAVINSIKNKSLLKIDAHIITKDEFLEMLKDEKANLGKEIARKHLITTNSEIFYLMLKKGIANGFGL